MSNFSGALSVIIGLHDEIILKVIRAGWLIFLVVSFDGKQSIAIISKSYWLLFNDFVIDMTPVESIENGTFGVIIS
jgi:hypothetical protein